MAVSSFFNRISQLSSMRNWRTTNDIEMLRSIRVEAQDFWNSIFPKHNIFLNLFEAAFLHKQCILNYLHVMFPSNLLLFAYVPSHLRQSFHGNSSPHLGSKLLMSSLRYWWVPYNLCTTNLPRGCVIIEAAVCWVG